MFHVPYKARGLIKYSLGHCTLYHVILELQGVVSLRKSKSSEEKSLSPLGWKEKSGDTSLPWNCQDPLYQGLRSSHCC